MTIEFAVLRDLGARLEIYDMIGRLTATFAEDVYSIGVHRLAWHPESDASGIYFVRLSSTGQAGGVVKKVLFLK